MQERTHSTEELNKIVLEYKDGVPGAAERLIDAFQPILAKYMRLCTLGIWDRHDSDITKFIAMIGSSNLDNTVIMLKEALTSYEKVDIQQELILALLTTARKYLNISSNFKYVFKRQLKELIKDPLVYSGNGKIALLPDMDSYKSAQDEELELDIAWINGRTVLRPDLQRLTPLQRAILKLVYHDGKTESEVVAELNMGSTRTLQRHLKAAKGILKFFRNSIQAAHNEQSTNDSTTK